MKNTRYLFADDEKILIRDTEGKEMERFVWNSKDDWIKDPELLRMFFGDFKVREVPEDEVPDLKKIARGWAYEMPDFPDNLVKKGLDWMDSQDFYTWSGMYTQNLAWLLSQLPEGESTITELEVLPFSRIGEDKPMVWETGGQSEFTVSVSLNVKYLKFHGISRIFILKDDAELSALALKILGYSCEPWDLEAFWKSKETGNENYEYSEELSVDGKNRVILVTDKRTGKKFALQSQTSS